MFVGKNSFRRINKTVCVRSWLQMERGQPARKAKWKARFGCCTHRPRTGDAGRMPALHLRPQINFVRTLLK